MSTGQLDVITENGRETYRWNGDQADRDAARAAFDKVIAETGGFAAVVDSPGKTRQVRSFDEVIERGDKTGTVTVQITRPIAGG